MSDIEERADRELIRRRSATYEVLCEAADVNTRLQLGWHAATMGWLDEPDSAL